MYSLIGCSFASLLLYFFKNPYLSDALETPSFSLFLNAVIFLSQQVSSSFPQTYLFRKYLDMPSGINYVCFPNTKESWETPIGILNLSSNWWFISPRLMLFNERTISLRVDGVCIPTGFSQYSVFVSTFFLLFTDDLLSTTFNSIHSLVDDYPLHCSPFCQRTLCHANTNVDRDRCVVSVSLNSDFGRISL